MRNLPIAAPLAAAIASILSLVGTASAQTVVTFDAAAASPSTSSFPFTLAGGVFQTYWTPNQIGAVPAGTITTFGLQFVNPINRTWPDVTIGMGETTVNGTASMSTTFAANYVTGTFQTVYTGPLTIVTTTTDEHWQVTLQTPFNYSGTNNLMVEIRVNGSSTGTGTVSHRISYPTPPGGDCARMGHTSDPFATVATFAPQTLGYGVRFSIVTGPPPVVTGVSPDPVDWLQTLTITGTDLDSASSVTIGGTAATITSNTSTQIEATVSASTPTGVQTVEVTTPSGTDNTQTVQVNSVAPTITSVSPDPASWLGTLTIDGSAVGNATSVTIGGTAATISSNTDTQIQVTVADGTPTGSQSVVVTTAAGSDTSTVTVNAVAPTVTALSPDPVDWLATLTITGTALATTTGVTIGGVAAAITSTTSTQVDVTVDVTTPTGSQTVEITTSGGTDNSQSVTVNGLPPSVTSVSPNPVATNGTLTIDGTALLNATSVTIGGVAGTILTNTATQITVLLSTSTPLGSAQIVAVTTAGGTDNTATVDVILGGAGGTGGGGGGGCCAAGGEHDTSAAWLFAVMLVVMVMVVRRRLV